jgi:Tfp pilus assembly protein FimT
MFEAHSAKGYKETFVRYSLISLMLLIAIVAILLGWFYDHQKLVNDRSRLNAEASRLCQVLAQSHSGTISLASPPPPSKSRSLDFSVEADRAQILKQVPLPWDFSRSVNDWNK